MRIIWTPAYGSPMTPFVRCLVDSDGIIRRTMKQWRVPTWDWLPQVVDYRLRFDNYDETLMGKPWHCHDDSNAGESRLLCSLGQEKEQDAQTDYDKRLASWLRLLGIEENHAKK